MIRLIKLDVKAEGLQSAGKIARVIGEEGVRYMCRSVRERSNKQGAIGQRLGTGNADSCVERIQNGSDAERGREL